MVIQHNMSAINAHRNLLINNSSTAKNLEKLSSGFRVNRAADDAAGLAISEKMRGQIRGLAMAEQNCENAVSLIQTAEGGLNETHAILHRMRELAVQASNGTYDDAVDRANLDIEVQRLKSEINRIAASTNYNNIPLLDGTCGGNSLDGTEGATLINGLTGATAATDTITNAGFNQGDIAYLIINNGVAVLQINGETYPNAAGVFSDGTNSITFSTLTIPAGTNGVIRFEIPAAGENIEDVVGTVASDDSEISFQIGANGTADQQVGMHIDNMSCDYIGDGTNVITSIDVTLSGNANAAIAIIDGATNQVSRQRAELGALQNRLEHTLNNLGVTRENLTAAESTIRDTDMAKEMMEFTKNNILVQASQAMLAQANMLPQGILSLLS